MQQSMFYDWPIGTVLAVLLSATLLVLLAIIAWLLFTAVDSWFRPRKKDIGRVYAKRFIPAHIELILVYNSALKTSIPQPISHPDNWVVGIEVNGQRDSISVSENAYHAISRGNQVLAEYVTGRFSGGFYLKDYSRI